MENSDRYTLIPCALLNPTKNIAGIKIGMNVPMCLVKTGGLGSLGGP